jgi:hypothetical protein
MTTKRILVLLTAVALMMVMLAMAVGPAFAQTELRGLTWGGNCLTTDFVQLCDMNTGQGDF